MKSGWCSLYCQPYSRAEGQWDVKSLLGYGTPEDPLGLWDGKDSGTVMSLVGHGTLEDIPIVPRGLWDVLTGLRNSDGKSG